MKCFKILYKKIGYSILLFLYFFISSVPAHPIAKKLTPQKTIPDNIACFIIDLKWDNNSLKILEFGKLTKSYFQGYDDLYGTGKIWKKVWNKLSKYQLPVWLIDKTINTQYHIDRVAFKHFSKQGFKNLDSLQELEQHQNTYKNNNDNKCNGNIILNEGIIVMKDKKKLYKKVNRFKKKHPGFLFVNDIAGNFVNNKYKSSLFFDDNKLKKFRPECKGYKTIYTPSLAQKIIQDFDSDTLVLKPITGSKGNGIIILKKKDLDKTLKKLFSQTIIKEENQSPEYKYWKKRNFKNFIVESFEKSKPITVDEKKYDPTMRMVTFITNHNGKINVSFLGGYWKLPAFSLSDTKTLTEKHKSNINKDRLSSAKISTKDRKGVEKILKNVLTKIYTKMLTYK